MNPCENQDCHAPNLKHTVVVFLTKQRLFHYIWSFSQTLNLIGPVREKGQSCLFPTQSVFFSAGMNPCEIKALGLVWASLLVLKTMTYLV